MRNVLVTGGAGFIGANFVRHLLTIDSTLLLVNLDLLTYAGSLEYLQDISDPRYIFVRGDIRDDNLIRQLLQDYQIDTIVHFAAESHVDRSISGPKVFIETNVLGTFTLLEAARYYWLDQQKWDEKQCRFHHVSTDEVYGSLKINEDPFNEKSRYVPNSPYSASKASSDHLVRAYYHTYQFPITISHCSNNYGPYQHPEKLIPTIIRACVQNQEIPIYGDGSHIRDWLYVKDHCRGIITILQQGKVGETYNLGGQCEISNLSLAKEICLLMDKYAPGKVSHQQRIQFVKDRPGHDWRYAIDISKISKELNWRPLESFTSGLEKTIQYYVQNKRILTFNERLFSTSSTFS